MQEAYPKDSRLQRFNEFSAPARIKTSAKQINFLEIQREKTRNIQPKNHKLKRRFENTTNKRRGKTETEYDFRSW